MSLLLLLLGAPTLLLPLSSNTPHRTNILFNVAWGAAPRATYYEVHMTPAPYCTPEVVTNVGPATNVTLSLPLTWDYGAAPGGGRWTAKATQWFICVVPWNAEHQGCYYPYMHYPGDKVTQFSALSLVCSTNLLDPPFLWTQTNSPWLGTNVTGAQFFRDFWGGSVSATNWFLFGNFDGKQWWGTDLGY